MTTLLDRTRVRGRLLSQILRVDAVACAPLAVGLLLLPGPVEDRLGLPTTLSLVVGLALLPWLAGLLMAASRPVRPGVILAIVAGNAVWVLATLALAAAGWASLTGQSTRSSAASTIARTPMPCRS